MVSTQKVHASLTQVLCAKVSSKPVMGVVYAKANATNWAIYQETHNTWTKASAKSVPAGSRVVITDTHNKLSVVTTPAQAVSTTPATTAPSGFSLCPETITLYEWNGSSLVPTQESIQVLCGTPNAPSAPVTSGPSNPASGFSLCPETITIDELDANGNLVPTQETLQVPCGSTTSGGGSTGSSPAPPAPAPSCSSTYTVPSPYTYDGVSGGSWNGFGTDSPWGQALGRSTNEIPISLLTTSAVVNPNNPDSATVTVSFAFNSICATNLRVDVGACYSELASPCQDTVSDSSWESYGVGDNQTMSYTTTITTGGRINVIPVSVQSEDASSSGCV